MTCEYRQLIISRSSEATGQDSTAFGLMIAGDYAFAGKIIKLTKLKLSIITNNMATQKLKPIHPGEILLEEFLEPMTITQYRLAQDINVPARRINEIIHGNRSVTADTALRLGKYFGVSPMFWLNLQARYDLENQPVALIKTLDRTIKTLQLA